MKAQWKKRKCDLKLRKISFELCEPMSSIKENSLSSQALTESKINRLNRP